MADKFYITTDNVIHVRGLKDVVTGEYINDATITATLYTSGDAEVAGADDIAVAYIEGTLGDYAGQIPDTITLTDGDEYYALITISGEGFITTVKVTRDAGYRTEA